MTTGLKTRGERNIMRVLLIEDDELLGDGLRIGLAQPKYAFTVDWIKDGESAQHAILSEQFDCIVLDLGLPRLEGLKILVNARDAGKKVPVLILTARDTIEDRVKGLDLGADDYLTKPVDLDELAARIRALIRRSLGRTDPSIVAAMISCSTQLLMKSMKVINLLSCPGVNLFCCKNYWNILVKCYPGKF